MRKCTHCKVTVGGTAKVCPLCQSKLIGIEESAEPCFPSPERLKNLSLLLKLLVFLLVAGSVGAGIVDYGMLKYDHYHFSKPVTVYAALALLSMYVFYKDHKSISKILLRGMLLISTGLAFTGLMFDCMELMVWVIVPIIFSATVIANFVFCFLDTKFTEDAMLCILVNFLIGIATEMYFLIRGIAMPLCWSITKLICTVSLIALIVFKGRKMFIEIKKRLNI